LGHAWTRLVRLNFFSRACVVAENVSYQPTGNRSGFSQGNIPLTIIPLTKSSRVWNGNIRRRLASVSVRLPPSLGSGGTSRRDELARQVPYLPPLPLRSPVQSVSLPPSSDFGAASCVHPAFVRLRRGKLWLKVRVHSREFASKKCGWIRLNSDKSTQVVDFPHLGAKIFKETRANTGHRAVTAVCDRRQPLVWAGRP